MTISLINPSEMVKMSMTRMDTIRPVGCSTPAEVLTPDAPPVPPVAQPASSATTGISRLAVFSWSAKNGYCSLIIAQVFR